MALALLLRVSARSSSYQRRSPEHEVLYGVVRQHFETMRLQARTLGGGEGLPSFVEREFREFLTCGCRVDRLVAFSCKGRGYAEWWNMPSREG